MITPDPAGQYKLQPGELSGRRGGVGLGDCADLRRKTLQDGRVTPKPTGRPCARGTHEVAAYLAEGVDYHWYRKDKDAVVDVAGGEDAAAVARKFGVPEATVRMFPKHGLALLRGSNLWTHKPGTTRATAIDSCGKPISNPDAACRGSGDMVYRVPCGRFCARDPGGGAAVDVLPAPAAAANAAALASEWSRKAHAMTARALAASGKQP